MILPIMLFFSLYSFSAFANLEDDRVNEYDSMYRYNALENKVDFLSIISDDKVLTEHEVVAEENIKKLKDVTEKQSSSMEKSENAISAIENRSALRTFLMGNKLGVLRFQMVQMKDQSYILDTLALKTESSAERTQIESQADISKQQQKKVENLILEQEDKFSLFGWLISSL